MKISAIEYLIDTAYRHPHKIAIVDSRGSYSFSELLSKGCDIAEKIQDMCLSRTSIAVFLNKSKEMVSAFAGSNMAGCFYVPLDTKQPVSRIENILSVLKCNTIITDREHLDGIPKDWSGNTLIIEDIFQDEVLPDRSSEILKKSKVIDTDPIYSIFTSGSTGTPKGVVVNHRGVIDYIDWAISEFDIKEDVVIGNQAPFYFDNSTLDIYLMYATGATLNIIPEGNFAFPAKLIDYLNENRITFVFWVPFILSNIANFKILDKKVPEFLRDVFFAGEVMPNRQLNYWRSHLPDCRYVNLYGPTEITVDCTYYIVKRNFDDDEPLPIGFPCRNTDILILQNRKDLCSQGEVGEICVRGSSLANGYYNNSEKTQEAFVQNPLNTAYPELIYCTGDLGYVNSHGEIMFVGRADSQIKHKGYRIELGEIENAVLGCGLVEEGCVVYNTAKQRITLFYSNQHEISVSELRQKVADRIPVYMLPSVLIREEKMVRNQNGKIDRAFYNKTVNG